MRTKTRQLTPEEKDADERSVVNDILRVSFIIVTILAIKLLLNLNHS